MKDVFGFVVFHCCFPVSEGVEGDLVDSLILEFAWGKVESTKPMFSASELCLIQLAIWLTKNPAAHLGT